MTNRSWRGKLRIEGETAWWSGCVGDTVSHRHFAAQAVFSDVPIRLLDSAGEEVSATCLLIEPNALHRLLPAHAADICYVEPSGSFRLPAPLRERIERDRAYIVSDAKTRSFWKEAIGRPAGRRIDTRVSHAISAIERLLPDGTVRLADVCAGTQLSIGRFRHLFSSEVGTPFQRYILWCRLRAAFDALIAGYNITRSAHAAGFADSAHFARTIKAMFGIRAGDLNLKA